MDIRKTGRFIKELRISKNLTQQDLARELKVTDKAVSRWETGRGLPDAESMIALSAFFSVSINELLLGKRNTSPEKSREEEARLAVECLSADKKSRIRRTWIAVFCAVSAFLLVIACAATVSLYKMVMGSEYCSIAEDYSSITIFGSRYLPFDIGDNECGLGTRLIKEAKVENTGFLTKLFFGDSIYLVKGCDNIEFVYLLTDYDYAPSKYYCLESELERYTSLMNDPKDIWVAEVVTVDRGYYDFTVDGEIVSAISSFSEESKIASENCAVNRLKGDESIAVFAGQSSGPFRQALGELLLKKSEYYWFDYSDIPEGQNNSDYSGIEPYAFPEELYEKIEKLFQMMNK